MLGQIFWGGLVAYLYLVGTTLYRLFYPAQCGAHTPNVYCVRPLLQQGVRVFVLRKIQRQRARCAQLVTSTPDAHH